MGYADLHIHTKYSCLGIFPFLRFPYPESATEPEEALEEANKKNLDLICITDHNTIKGAIKAEKLEKDKVIVGEEISTTQGEILGLFINEKIPEGMTAPETIDMIHGQGGLAIAPHPYSAICSSVGDLIFSLELDGIETFNAYHRDGYSNRIAAMEGAGFKKAKVAGSDAHYHEMIGNAYTEFDGNTKDDLFKAIERCKTTPRGKQTSLIQAIKWSVSVTEFGLRTIVNHDEGLFSLERLNLKRKLAYLAFGLIYFAFPVPMLCAIAGDAMVKRRGKKLWQKFNGIK